MQCTLLFQLVGNNVANPSDADTVRRHSGGNDAGDVVRAQCRIDGASVPVGRGRHQSFGQIPRSQQETALANFRTLSLAPPTGTSQLEFSPSLQR